MDINVTFANRAQREFYYSTARNQCFSGGFCNGKSWVGCFKVITLLLTFPNYRVVIARQRFNDLTKTTMETFLKMCPSELIDSHNTQSGVTHLKNSSTIYWMHLDAADENSLRGLEINSVLIDQAEETDEKVYDVLDSRVGRWDGAVVPNELISQVENWPMSATGKPLAPSYHMLLCNPDTQFHYIYRKFHPGSIDRKENYFFVEGEWDSTLGSTETYEEAIKRDPEWVNKYVKGEWGLSAAQIHYVPPSIILDPAPALLDRIKTKGKLFRILDHGDAAPTCCLWAAAIDGVYIFYREYYVPNKVISYHRQAINDLSEKEEYSGNYADPSIFRKASQKDGGFWSVADEYCTSILDVPTINFIPADNNEFATRNRINELLLTSTRYRNPITKLSPAPGMYFLKSTQEYPYGCKESIKQLGSQRKKLLGTIEGKSIYSDERDMSIIDHAYDCIRYFVAMHGSQPQKEKRKVVYNSFAYYNALMKYKEQQVPGSVSN